jgi:Cu2+-exporting ATPase
MGGGTDLARSQGDVVLLSNDLQHLATGIEVSRHTLRVIRQNLAWAFAYNLCAIPLAMSGLVTPWLAGIGMSASSLFVVLNALRLQALSPRKT